MIRGSSLGWVILGLALGSHPTTAPAESWTNVAQIPGGMALCVDRDSLRREGSRVYYRTLYCVNAMPGLDTPHDHRVDCSQDFSRGGVVGSLVNGAWSEDEELDWMGPDAIGTVAVRFACSNG